MRTCSNCRTEDRPQLDNQTPCSCGANISDPMQHGQECKAIVHEVVRYYMRIAKVELTHDGMLSSYYRGLKWQLVKDGERIYRVKELCRDCMGNEETAQARKREYDKACKRARGQDDTTYSQMLAQQ